MVDTRWVAGCTPGYEQAKQDMAANAGDGGLSLLGSWVGARGFRPAHFKLVPLISGTCTRSL